MLKKRISIYLLKSKIFFNAIEDELEYILKSFHSIFIDAKLYEFSKHGMIMIGGGSLMSGLMERLGQKTELKVRLGKIKTHAKKSLGNSAVFASVIGLAHFGVKNSFSYIYSSNGHAQWYNRALNKVKELYLEYF